MKSIIKGEAPLCKCGCGQPVKRSKTYNSWNSYIATHQRRGSDYKPKGEAPLCKCGCGKFVRYNLVYHKWHNYLKGHKPLIQRPLCACGCGQPVRYNYNYYMRRWNKYVKGHNPKTIPIVVPDPEEAPLCACGCGEKVSWSKHNYWNKYVFKHSMPTTKNLINLVKSAKSARGIRGTMAIFRSLTSKKGIPYEEQNRMLREIGIVVPDEDVSINFNNIKMKSIGKSILKDLFPNGF